MVPGSGAEIDRTQHRRDRIMIASTFIPSYMKTLFRQMMEEKKGDTIFTGGIHTGIQYSLVNNVWGYIKLGILDSLRPLYIIAHV